tara:strand:- start:1649 stop:2155 length:507 start_codon:yes stop_codon:yes gene_type:complete
MPAKWKEVSAYTGKPVEEDAPTNAVAHGQVALPPDALMKKKKKKETLIDARSKEYKAHRAKLEAKRAKRAEQKNRFINKVKESINEFNRECFITEDNIDVLRNIVKTKSAKPLKFSDGTMKVDLFTASAITQVLDKVNKDNKDKLTRMVNGKKGQFMAAANAVMKMVK